MVQGDPIKFRVLPLRPNCPGHEPSFAVYFPGLSEKAGDAMALVAMKVLFSAS
jgi:hypothetical protein